MRDIRILKIFRAVRLLSRPGGVTVKEMMAEFDADRKTIKRMFQTLETLGFPLYDDAPKEFEKGKRWKLDEDYVARLPNISLPKVELEISEILALYLIRGETTVYRNTGIEEGLDSAFNKFRELLPTSMVKRFEEASKLFIQANRFAKDYSGKEETIESLALAMLDKRVLRIRYDSFFKNKEVSVFCN